jgi:hypothetical protein
MVMCFGRARWSVVTQLTIQDGEPLFEVEYGDCSDFINITSFY